MKRIGSRSHGRRGVLVAALCAAVGSACAPRATLERYPELAEHAGREIADVDFVGGEPFTPDTLQKLVETHPTRCSLLGLPLCVPFTSLGRDRQELSPQGVVDDAQRLSLFYRREGYFGTTVRPEVEEIEERVRVMFRIARSEPVTVDSLTLEITEAVLDADSLARHLPLQPGDTFDLGEFVASADTVLRVLQANGHAYAEVLRNYSVDNARRRARARLVAVAGPRVVVDSIVVQGAEHLGRNAALQQLAFREGDLLRRSELIESQRNLYALQLVQFATVSIAPDSLQAAPGDSTRATVQVLIVEAPVNAIDAAIGYGSVECFRGDASWENRSFGGGARRLQLSGSLSKVGIGQGLDRSICRGFGEDVFEATLDYRLAAHLTQPYFLSARNHLTLDVSAQRYSEPGVFQRQVVGGRAALNRRLSQNSVLSAGLDVERGTTVASEALFCGAFQVCDPGLIELLRGARFRNTVSLSVLHDRRDSPLDPSRGYVTRSALAWAPPWLLSDVTFTRWSGELDAYWELRPGVVGAGSMRLGNFFQSASPGRLTNFLPPEDRFYAGGASSVRGFDRNGLGPGVYVASEIQFDEAGDTLRDPSTGNPVPVTESARFVPSGGTSLTIVNTEVRFPSPWRRDILRLAAFVDAGAVGEGNFWDTSVNELRVTPGIGIRLQTPVGPVRLDLAYNPHGRQTGPLYVIEADGTLRRVQDAFRPEVDGLVSRLRLHVGVGQAF